MFVLDDYAPFGHSVSRRSAHRQVAVQYKNDSEYTYVLAPALVYACLYSICMYTLNT